MGVGGFLVWCCVFAFDCPDPAVRPPDSPCACGTSCGEDQEDEEQEAPPHKPGHNTLRQMAAQLVPAAAMECILKLLRLDLTSRVSSVSSAYVSFESNQIAG